jgi:hypothetical protein
LLDSLSQPEWRHHVVRNLSASEELELVLVALDRRGVPGTSGGWFSRHRHSLYHAYRWVDEGLFGRGLGALEPSDLSGVAGDCTRVEIDGAYTITTAVRFHTKQRAIAVSDAANVLTVAWHLLCVQVSNCALNAALAARPIL